MKANQFGFTSTELLITVGGLIVLAGIGGWIANIVKLADMCCDVSGWLILRAIGVVIPPLGAVLGFV